MVQKYGGTSLATPRHIQNVAQRIQRCKDRGDDLVVVVSAMGHMTDHLTKLAYRTVAEPSQREMDMLLSSGERVSMALLAMALEPLGISAISFTGSQVGILTSSDHRDAKILEIRAQRLKDALGKKQVAIVAGFQGVSFEKEITTLGRGGSDTTAVALAASLGADYCEILTDVKGLYTADPRLVTDAHLIAECSYQTCLEMSRLGAKMHVRSIELARRFGVKVVIRSSESWDDQGTVVSGMDESRGKMEGLKIQSVTSKDGLSFMKFEMRLKDWLAMSAKVPSALSCMQFSGDVVQVIVESEKAQSLTKLFPKEVVTQISDVALISLVGEGICGSPEVISKMIQVLDQAGIEVILITSNSISVSAAVPGRLKAAALQALHSHFISV